MSGYEQLAQPSWFIAWPSPATSSHNSYALRVNIMVNPPMPHLIYSANSLDRSPANPEPPADLLSDFVLAYREKLYFQPLPLFDPRRLQLKIGTLPHYLRWSFLALTLHFTSHNFYYGLEAKAIEYYTTSARSIVVDMAAEGLAQLEVMQALCLLALCDHIGEFSLHGVRVLEELAAKSIRDEIIWSPYAGLG
jgi:hypothetical protein